MHNVEDNKNNMCGVLVYYYSILAPLLPSPSIFIIAKFIAYLNILQDLFNKI